METSLFLRGSPLSTNPPIFEQFFHDHPLCPNFKNKTPSLMLGGETIHVYMHLCMYVCMHACMYVFCFFRFDLHIALQIFVTCVFYLGFVVANLKTIKKY